MCSIKKLVNDELNDLFFSYSYSEISVSDKSKKQIVNSVLHSIQRISGSLVSNDIINEINSILDTQLIQMKTNNF